MLEFEITDPEELTRQFDGLGTAIKELNGKLCEVRFDPSKPDQVQAAIETMERAVDERLSEFPDNPLVQQFATGTKEKMKAEILKRANEARQQLALNAIPFDPRNTSGLFGGTASTPLKRWTRGRRTRRRTI